MGVVNSTVVLAQPRLPYLTAPEFRAMTGSIQLGQLALTMPDTNVLEAWIDRKLRAASGEIDRLCNQGLLAEQRVAIGRSRVKPDGTIQIRIPAHPVWEVIQVEVGATPGTLQAVDLDTAWLEGQQLLLTPTSWGGLSIGGAARPSSGVTFWRVTYVSGFPVAKLTANALAGATSVTVDSTVGFYAGPVPQATRLTIHGSQANVETTCTSVTAPTTAMTSSTEVISNAHR